MARSCLPSLSTLQAHGLTPALLEIFATFVAQQQTGSFLFHVSKGQILAYEEHHKRRVDDLLDEIGFDNKTMRKGPLP
jgi:hypothetical protein